MHTPHFPHSGPIVDNNYMVDGPRNFHSKCFFCDTCGKNPIEEHDDFKWDSCTDKLVCWLRTCVLWRGIAPHRFSAFALLGSKKLSCLLLRAGVLAAWKCSRPFSKLWIWLGRGPAWCGSFSCVCATARTP